MIVIPKVSCKEDIPSYVSLEIFLERYMCARVFTLPVPRPQTGFAAAGLRLGAGRNNAAAAVRANGLSLSRS
jgi:hypothetical protein